MTIAEKLDKEFPTKCAACNMSLKRVDAKWKNHAVRLICPHCGLDQSSAEAYNLSRYKETPDCVTFALR